MKPELITLGKPKHNALGVLIKPENRFRVIIQHKPTKGNNYEEMKSVMVYDFTGRATATTVKKKIIKLFGGK